MTTHLCMVPMTLQHDPHAERRIGAQVNHLGLSDIQLLLNRLQLASLDLELHDVRRLLRHIFIDETIGALGSIRLPYTLRA